jgi:hypothetical protein
MSKFRTAQRRLLAALLCLPRTDQHRQFQLSKATTQKTTKTILSTIIISTPKRFLKYENQIGFCGYNGNLETGDWPSQYPLPIQPFLRRNSHLPYAYTIKPLTDPITHWYCWPFSFGQTRLGWSTRKVQHISQANTMRFCASLFPMRAT